MRKTKDTKSQNWKGRPYKTFIRDVVCCEIRELPNPTDLRGLHLPSSELGCIRAFEAAKLPFTSYVGVEYKKEVCAEIRKRAKTLASSTQKKLVIAQGSIYDVFRGEGGNPRSKAQPTTVGFDVLYLDMMCAFQQTFREMCSNIAHNTGIFQRAFDKGNPAVVVFTISLQGNRIKENDMQALDCFLEEKPPNASPLERYKLIQKKFHNFVDRCMAVGNLTSTPTHSIIYKDEEDGKKGGMMASFGFHIYPIGTKKGKAENRLAFLGIQNFRNNPESLEMLTEWEENRKSQKAKIPDWEERKKPSSCFTREDSLPDESKTF